MSIVNIRRKLSVLLVAVAVASCIPARAQGADFNKALSVFNAGQYPQAADLFTQYLRQQPNDALAHYYLGVTWHCLGRGVEAQNEYSWVQKNATDQELLKRANAGLAVTSRFNNNGALQSALPAAQGYQQSAPQAMQGQVPANNGQPWQGAQTPQASFAPAGPDQATFGNAAGPTTYQGAPYQPSLPANYQGGYGAQNYGAQNNYAGAGAPAAYNGTGTPGPGSINGAMGAQPMVIQGRIIDMYTDWCGWCKKFEPFFLQAQAKYGASIQFQRVNGEAPDGERLVKKYHVRAYPTILLLDNDGKVKKRIDGAPQSLQAFEQSIFAAYPSARTY